MSSDGQGPIRRLFLGLIQRISSRRAARIASRPPSTNPQAQCYCDPTVFPNPGIIVVNDKLQPIPGAQVYVDGNYVGTTGTDPETMGRIWPTEFTPCVAHQVKAVACDGTSAIATLGYWCYPSQEATTSEGASVLIGQGAVNNRIVVFTDQCGGSTSTPTTTTNQPPYHVAPPPSSSPSQAQCYCDPALNPNPGIIVINNQRQMIPDAQVYIDGKYVGTTGTGITNMGMIAPDEFTPCTPHQVTVVACDGTTTTATLGYWCYPGHEIVNNVVVVPTSNCGGSISYAGPI